MINGHRKEIPKNAWCELYAKYICQKYLIVESSNIHILKYSHPHIVKSNILSNHATT